MIEILSAYSDGLFSIVQSYMPRSFAQRHRAWVDRLCQDFELRETRDGKTAAQQWLVNQLRNPSLPDFRTGKSLVDDKVLVSLYEKLKDAMRPIFAQHCYDAEARRREAAAPIVSKILQRTVTPQELPSTQQVAQFCHEVLGTSSVNVSRARRRLSGEAARLFQRATELLEAAASDRKNPKDAAKAKQVLTILHPDT